jgi:putative membrane protein
MSRFQRSLLVFLALALAASCIAPPFPTQMALQHAPTVVALLALPWLARRYRPSDAAFACVVGFLLLHVLGARFIYSYVPYDRWTEALFGLDLTATFGFRRNHYDRLVHFAFGLLAVRPVWEVWIRHGGLSRRTAAWLAVEWVLALSALYELFEWSLTLALSPADAGAYNGEQGDLWDAQKDIGLALLGALLGAVLLREGKERRAGEQQGSPP